MWCVAPPAHTLLEWLRDHPPPDERFGQTLATVADRTRAGEDFRVAVREFLDEFALRPAALRARALADAPPRTGDERHDAFLAALAEHLAHLDDLDRPAWAVAPGRSLDRMWFVSGVPGFRAIELREPPAAFRRRGIFLSRGLLHRV